MQNHTKKRAFYTLTACLAALALCTAGALALLLPTPRARTVCIPGAHGPIAATVQLPGKLARGAPLPLAVLCTDTAGNSPLAAALAAQGIASVQALPADSGDVEAILRYMRTACGTGRAALVGRGTAGPLVSLYPQQKGGVAALVLWQPTLGADAGSTNAALRAADLPTLLVYSGQAALAETVAVVGCLTDGAVTDNTEDIAAFLNHYLK